MGAHSSSVQGVGCVYNNFIPVSILWFLLYGAKVKLGGGLWEEEWEGLVRTELEMVP